MARIRTIKPEFWKHEALCEMPEATHMLAAALLNYADDFGYFNANPRLIHGEIYPLREPSIAIPESLRSLQTINYVRLGTGSDGRRYGHIIEFSTHQRVSHPTPSKIADISIAWDVSGIHPEDVASPPESFVPEQGTGNREQGREGKGTVARSADADVPAAFEAFNAVAREFGWPEAQAITDRRRAAMRKRLVEAGGLVGWNAGMAKARASPHLNGTGKRGKGYEKWTPDIDFFLQQSSFTKLMEGKYDDRSNNQGPSGFAAVLAGAGAALAGQQDRDSDDGNARARPVLGAH